MNLCIIFDIHIGMEAYTLEEIHHIVFFFLRLELVPRSYSETEIQYSHVETAIEDWEAFGFCYSLMFLSFVTTSSALGLPTGLSLIHLE